MIILVDVRDLLFFPQFALSPINYGRVNID